VEVDVAIVGGGPAGLATALFLESRAKDLARRTVVLERATYPRDKVCAGAVGGRGLALLASIGVRPDVPKVEIRGIAVTTRVGELLERSDRVVGWVVRRRELDAELARIARGRGIAIEEGRAVREVRAPEDGPVELELEGGERFRAKVVVGADGVGSVVRRAVGWPRGGIVAQAVELDTERSPSDLPEDVLHFDLTEPDLVGYAWDFPTPLDGKTRMSRGVYDLGPRALDPAARLARRTRDPIALPKRRFSERGVTLGERLAKPRILLVGEAAGIDPVLGEGIAQAIAYGAYAGEYLARVLPSARLAFEDYAPLSPRRRLGIDLELRARALPLVYGRTRRALEWTVSHSSPLARAGLAYFGGARVPRADLARAAFDLARGCLMAGLSPAGRW
jgi:flavin-dependent dehydrogenase